MYRKLKEPTHKALIENELFIEMLEEGLLEKGHCYNNVCNFVNREIDIAQNDWDYNPYKFEDLETWVKLRNELPYKVCLGYIDSNNLAGNKRIYTKHCYLIDDNNEIIDLSLPLLNYDDSEYNSIKYYTFKELNFGEYLVMLFSQENDGYPDMPKLFLEEEVELLNKLYNTGLKVDTLNLRDLKYYLESCNKSSLLASCKYLNAL